MRVLSLSTDKKIFEEGSAVAVRQVEYGKEQELHIVVFTLKSDGIRTGIHKLSENVFAYPTASYFKTLAPFDAIRIGKGIGEHVELDWITCQDPFFTACVGTKLKKKFNIPLHLQVHTDIGSPYFGYTVGNRIRKIMAKHYLPQADKIRVVSARIKKFLIEKWAIPGSKIEVKPIAVDTEKIKAEPVILGADLHKKYPQFKKIVLMASRLSGEKDFSTALHAFKNVVEKKPDTGLLIVGSGGESDKISGVTQELGLQKNIVTEKWLERKVLFSYYKTADAFLSTSLYEGYGMSLAEAHAAGLPIVSTNVGIAPEIAKHICKVGDSACLARKLIEILS